MFWIKNRYNNKIFRAYAIKSYNGKTYFLCKSKFSWSWVPSSKFDPI